MTIKVPKPEQELPKTAIFQNKQPCDLSQGCLQVDFEESWL